MEKINCHPFSIVLKSMKCRCVTTNSIHKTPQPSTGSVNEEIGMIKTIL